MLLQVQELKRIAVAQEELLDITRYMVCFLSLAIGSAPC